MDFHGNFRARGQYDVSELQNLLASLGEDVWTNSVAKVARVHRHSRGLFLKNDIKPEHLFGRVHPNAERVLAVIGELFADIAAQLGTGYFIRAQFSRHLGGHGFDLHDDNFSYTLRHSHRMHLAVSTNPGVWLAVGGERRHLEVGQIWEVNNTRKHQGRNEGTTPRIHMIIDYATPIASRRELAKYLLNLATLARRCGHLLCRPALADEATPAPARAAIEAAKVEARVVPGVVVGLNYRLLDRGSGATLEVDDTEEPLAYVHGRGHLPPKLERALDGLRPGVPFAVDLEPEEAFGGASQIEVSARELGLGRALVTRHEHLLTGTPELPLLLRRVQLGLLGSSATYSPDHIWAGKKLRIEGQVRYLRELDPAERAHAVYHGPPLAACSRAPEILSQPPRTWAPEYDGPDANQYALASV